MSRTVFVFAIMASLLMLACAAAHNTGGNALTATTTDEESPLGGLKSTLTELIQPLLSGGVLNSFKLSSVFGLFDQTMEEMTAYGKEIEVLHEQLLKEFKDIENISAVAKAAAEKAKQSGALTQKINFIAARAETAKAQKAEIEKDKGLVKNAKKEADNAKKQFETKEAELSSIIVQAVSYLMGTDTSSSSSSTTDGLMAHVNKGAPIAAEMYTLFKKFSKASDQSREAFQEAKIASKTIKQYLTESQEIQTCLRP